MLISTPALILSSRQHGEHGAVVRALTPEHGLQAGYVRGGRSRRLRPVLIPGNGVQAEFRARVEEQLAALTVELVDSRAPLLAEPLPAAAIEWACGLTVASLPEAHPYPRLYQALDGLLRAIASADSARAWSPALAKYERLLLTELGYGDGTDDTGWAIATHLLTGRLAELMQARERLVDRLRRALP